MAQTLEGVLTIAGSTRDPGTIDDIILDGVEGGMKGILVVTGGDFYWRILKMVWILSWVFPFLHVVQWFSAHTKISFFE